MGLSNRTMVEVITPRALFKKRGVDFLCGTAVSAVNVTATQCMLSR